MKKKKKFNKIKEAKRAARMIIGKPDKGKKIGPHVDQYKEQNKNQCRVDIEEEE